MRSIFSTIAFLVISFGISTAVLPQQAASNSPNTGIATLFARDPLTQSLCLRDGRAGAVFQNGQVRNRCSDLNFNSYSADSFRVGVEGGKQGVILDLGTPAELRNNYRYQETVGQGQGFASINVVDGKVLILKDYKTGELQELARSGELFQKPNRDNESVPVKVGNIYLMRITDLNDPKYEQFAKVLVLAFTPGESVTVRWHLMSDQRIAKL